MTCRLLHVEQLNVVYETCGHPAIITIAVVSSLSIGSTPVVAKGHIAAAIYRTALSLLTLCCGVQYNVYYVEYAIAYCP